MRTVAELEAFFDDHEGDYINFKLVTDRMCERPDLHALMLLDNLVPSERGHDMISAAEHDIIYLDVSLEELAKVATDAELLELIRCGVLFTEDSLAMFT